MSYERIGMGAVPGLCPEGMTYRQVSGSTANQTVAWWLTQGCKKRPAPGEACCPSGVPMFMPRTEYPKVSELKCAPGHEVKVLSAPCSDRSQECAAEIIAMLKLLRSKGCTEQKAAVPLGKSAFCCPSGTPTVKPPVAPPVAPPVCPTNCWWDYQKKTCECAPYGPPSAPPVDPETLPPEPTPEAEIVEDKGIKLGHVLLLGGGAAVLYFVLKGRS